MSRWRSRSSSSGSLHRELAVALALTIRRRPVAILRATRCLDGAVAEKDEPGAFASAGDLTPVKARVELVLQLLLARRRAASPPG